MTDQASMPVTEEEIGKLAHFLTGYIASNCCHRTGGYRPSAPGCDCREIARDLLEGHDRLFRSRLSPAATWTLSLFYQAHGLGSGRTFEGFASEDFCKDAGEQILEMGDSIPARAPYLTLGKYDRFECTRTPSTPASGWRTMESVPEHEPILVFVPKINRGHDSCEVVITYNFDGDRSFWTNGGANGGDDLYFEHAPTHWMPLPTPPATGEGTGTSPLVRSGEGDPASDPGLPVPSPVVKP